jgi:anti-sigma-K factor RskA
MMTNDGAKDARQTSAPTEIEGVLPWYAAGTLRRRDRARVEDALRADPDLARQAELAREELAETICLNESLGVPSARAMDRLMAAIDDHEQVTARKLISARAVAGRFANFIAGFSPRTLAIGASAAVLAIALQATLLVGVLTKPADAPKVAMNEQHGRGTFAMVRFAREASAGEITRFLEDYQATLVDGPKPGGFYRVRIAMTSLAKEEFAHVVARMRQERVVASAEPIEPSE